MIRVRFHETGSAPGSEGLGGHIKGGKLICAGSEIKPAEVQGEIEIIEMDEISELAKALEAGYQIRYRVGEGKVGSKERYSAANRKRFKWPKGAEGILRDAQITHGEAARLLGWKYGRVVQARLRMNTALNPHPWGRKSKS